MPLTFLFFECGRIAADFLRSHAANARRTTLGAPICDHWCRVLRRPTLLTRTQQASAPGTSAQSNDGRHDIGAFLAREKCSGHWAAPKLSVLTVQEESSSMSTGGF